MMIDEDELYGLACWGVVAYRTSVGIVCDDPECLAWFADLMQTAKPMTQADVDAEAERGVSCSCCCKELSR